MARDFKKAYKGWKEYDHKRGFKLVTDTYERTKCKDDGVETKSFVTLKYQPKGYWTEILDVKIGGDGSFEFTLGSGGTNGDVDGFERMKNLQLCFEDAYRIRDWNLLEESLRFLEEDKFETYEEMRLASLERKEA